MKTAGAIMGNLNEIAQQASELEQLGADVAFTAELGHDPMMQLAIAATGTQSIKLMTGITVAFARSPMTLALAAHDVNALSGGRLILGIGSQIKPHIEKRYSMPWSHALVKTCQSHARVCVGNESDLGFLVRGCSTGFSW